MACFCLATCYLTCKGLLYLPFGFDTYEAYIFIFIFHLKISFIYKQTYKLSKTLSKLENFYLLKILENLNYLNFKENLGRK